MSRVRTFIAVELSRKLRERLVSLQETMARTANDVNWVEFDNMHVTLLFLGEVDLREISKVCSVVADTCARHPAFDLELQGIGGFPNLDRPRVLYVGIAEGTDALRQLHDDLESPLEELGAYRREDRRYTPHATLGRLRSAGPPSPELAASLARRSDWQGGAMRVEEIQVFSSELRPKGPVYTVLGRARLAKDD